MSANEMYQDLIADAQRLVQDAATRRGTIRLSEEVARLLEDAKVESPPASSHTSPVPQSSGDDQNQTLEALRAEVASCEKCDLFSTRTQTVFSDGNPTSDVVFVGEAPGKDEDEQGVPFVGRAGQLLSRIIQIVMEKKREDVYICNVLKCRPPGNRDPKPEEREACWSHLERQLELVQPKVICCLGKQAAHTLLNKQDESIARMRGSWHFWRDVPVRVTYHPSYLLRLEGSNREGAEKRKVQEDILAVMRVLKGEESPQAPGANQGTLV